MHRIMLLVAALAPITQESYVIDSTNKATVALITTPLPRATYRNKIPLFMPKSRTIKKGSRPSLLTYLFDYNALGKKHDHNTFSAPSFQIDSDNNKTSFEADTRSTVVFDCRISSLRDKTVTWVKMTNGNSIELLTIDRYIHTPDKRFRINLADDSWLLEIKNVNVRDSATYCCQVSTHPPLKRNFKLLVHAPEIKMINETFIETSETLSLKCSVLHLYPGDVIPVLRWYKGNSTVSLDEIRGGVYIETNLLTLDTHLQMARMKMEDAGNYTCALQAPIKMKTVARVHVLKGSSLAELQSLAEMTTIYKSLLLASILVGFGTYWDVG